MPTTVIAGNWKMNTSLSSAIDLATGVKSVLRRDVRANIILCPPSIFLTAVKDAVQGSSIKIGAQNVHFEDSGAFTGETAVAMLHGICDYVIIGHSERRQLFGEDDHLVNKKVITVFQHGLRPILCVGETLEQRESGQAWQVIEAQIRAGLVGVGDSLDGLVVAYEPIWAIGTGQAATPEIAAEIMGGVIQHTLRSLFGDQGNDVSLIYGGSVNPGNISGYAAQECIHGALVGGASLQVNQFVEIVTLAAAAKG